MSSVLKTLPDPTQPPDLKDITIQSMGEMLDGNNLPVIYCEGSTIFRQGEEGTFAYLIERGEVEVSLGEGDSRTVVARLGPGELLGEMASIDSGQRSATAIACTETELLPIQREQIVEAVENSSPLVGLLLRVTINRLRTFNQGSDAAEDSVNTVSLDSKLQDSRERALARLQLERHLREGLDAREFELHYQPIVTLPEGRLVGFEALLRWLRPGIGYVPPGEFITAAEDSGLIVPIGLWVVTQACSEINRFQRYFQRWNDTAESLFVSINISARQFAHQTHADAIIDAIRNSKVDPKCVKLEMTEHLLVDRPEAAARSLARFKRLGITLAVDDFGTGYSSLSYLHRFPLDTLKIDRSFVVAMENDSGSEKVVQGIIRLANALGMKVVAEGIETTSQLERLSALGCEYAQGYLFSRPVPVDGAIELLRTPFLAPGDEDFSATPSDTRPVIVSSSS